MLFCAVLIFKSNFINAQEKPIWLDGYYDETSESYLKVVQGTSKNSYEFARKNAMMQVIKDNFLESDVELKMYGDMFDIRTDNNVKVKARVIAEYQEKIEYDYICHLLVQVMKNPNTTVSTPSTSAKTQKSVMWKNTTVQGTVTAKTL